MQRISIRNQPLEQAYWLLAHPSEHLREDGHTVAELLLSMSEPAAMSSEELQLLAQAFEWSGRGREALEIALLDLRRSPADLDRSLRVHSYMSSVYRSDPILFLSACNRCIEERIGPIAFWLLIKADQYVELAKSAGLPSGCEWSSDEDLHRDLMQLAADSIATAIEHEPEFRSRKFNLGGNRNWNLRFAAVLQDPLYWHLMQDADTV